MRIKWNSRGKSQFQRIINLISLQLFSWHSQCQLLVPSHVSVQGAAGAGAAGQAPEHGTAIGSFKVLGSIKPNFVWCENVPTQCWNQEPGTNGDKYKVLEKALLWFRSELLTGCACEHSVRVLGDRTPQQSQSVTTIPGKGGQDTPTIPPWPNTP